MLETDRQGQREDRFAEMSRRGKKKNCSGLPSQATTFITQRECTSRYIRDIFFTVETGGVFLWLHAEAYCFPSTQFLSLNFTVKRSGKGDLQDHGQVDLNQYLVIFHNKTNTAKKGSRVTLSMVAVGWGGGLVVESIRDISQD